MSTRPPLALGMLLLLGSISCQEREGACPEILDVAPRQAGSQEAVTVTGHGFSLGHSDLWGDARAVPPTVELDISMRDTVEPFVELFPDMFTEEDLAAMEAMDMTLAAERVVFVSADELEVTLPELDWSDLTSAAEMFGSPIPEIPPIIDEIPMSSTLRVTNPSGCRAAWDQTFSFLVQIEAEADADADADADGEEGK